MLDIAVICGGISEERGISLNSARSFLDHTCLFNIQLTMIYVNPEGEYYRLTPSQLYSNTPSDFDFKLARIAQKLEKHHLVSLLKQVDLAFPLIHGVFGEDGTLQAFLEEHHIPYVGSCSATCKRIFNKYTMHTYLQSHGFPSLPTLLISSTKTPIESFWNQHQLKRAVIKPTESGSSLGVKCASSLTEAHHHIAELKQAGFKDLLLEPYCEGKEFTVCVLQNHQQKPVALIPLEIDIQGKNGTILSFRRKYLPTEETRYHCPPRFAEEVIHTIRHQAEHLFAELNLRDFVRIDGWVTETGEIIFSDFNPISGMEQNSFLFQQASRVGLSHADLIAYILESAFLRYHIHHELLYTVHKEHCAAPIYVLMGGSTAERQTSLMSGTNVFLKLKQDPHYHPIPFLLDKEHDVWELPYTHILHHTVEEVKEHCQFVPTPAHLALKETIRHALGLCSISPSTSAVKMSLNQFLEKAVQEHAFVFIALHGGMGEDGTLQKLLEEHNIPFNGSDARASALCMDKKETSETVAQLNHPQILAMHQMSFELSSVEQEDALYALWDKVSQELGTTDLLIKPQCDGCSAGVFRFCSYNALLAYICSALKRTTSFEYEGVSIDMPSSSRYFLIEPFIHTDKIIVSGTHLHLTSISGWCETTIGVLEKDGIYTALPPSITVAEKNILSIEEKFQGGTGINLTPPPEEFLSKPLQEQVQNSASLVARALGIRNYARFDLFVQCSTGVIRVIEANTLPALTPSTVLFHQALCHTPSLHPKKLLSLIIEHTHADQQTTVTTASL
jgi:D-alanine--D-alanine ligase